MKGWHGRQIIRRVGKPEGFWYHKKEFELETRVAAATFRGNIEFFFHG